MSTCPPAGSRAVSAARLAAAGGLAGAAAMLCVPALAQGMFRCIDAQGRAYMMRETVSANAGLTCTPAQPVDRAAALGLGRASAAQVPQAAAAAPAPGPTRTGLLMLAEPGSILGGGLALARRAVPLAGADRGPSAAIASIIESAARRHGHELRLLHAIVQVESGFNPNAVSPAGAIGLMQVMPATGARMGVSTPHRSLFDPATNVEAGAKYLRLLLNMFPGRMDLAIAAYNAGEGAVMRYRGIPPYAETQHYVRKVLAHYRRNHDN